MLLKQSTYYTNFVFPRNKWIYSSKFDSQLIQLSFWNLYESFLDDFTSYICSATTTILIILNDLHYLRNSLEDMNKVPFLSSFIHLNEYKSYILLAPIQLVKDKTRLRRIYDKKGLVQFEGPTKVRTELQE